VLTCNFLPILPYLDKNIKSNAPTKFGGEQLMGCQVNDRQPFYQQDKYDLDLWPLDPKINRDHLLVMSNHHTKFEVPRPKRSLVIDRNLFFTRSM
jgi:hypothetical protein